MKRSLWIVCVTGVLLFALSAMPVVWAMPEQQGGDWTVPTRTPPPPPPTTAPPTTQAPPPPPTDPPAPPTDPPATQPPATEPSTVQPTATVKPVLKTKTPTPTAATVTPQPTSGSRTPTPTRKAATPGASGRRTATATPTATYINEESAPITGTSLTGDAQKVATETAQSSAAPANAAATLTPTPTPGFPDEGDHTVEGAGNTLALIVGGGILLVIGLFVLLAGLRRR